MVALTLWATALVAQQVVRLGKHEFVPEQNVGARTRSRALRPLPLGEAVQGRHNVLMQFSHALTFEQRAALQREGVALTDYVGGNAYFATVKQGFVPARMRGNRMTSLIPIRGEWKMDPRLEDWRIPDYAQAGMEAARVQLFHFPNVTTEWAKSELARLGVPNVEDVPAFRLLVVDLPKEKLHELAELPWVASLGLIPAPQAAFNAQGRTLGRGNLLALPGALGGRGLTGKGVKVGVWDGNVVPHFDFAARLQQKEFEVSVEESEGHGVHVVGSIAGAGLLNPRMQGVAPAVELYTYNFNRQSNGLNEQAEMLYALDGYNIFLSSHSYGPQMRYLCPYLDELGYYNSIANDYLVDLLVALVPEVTQVYAAGNDQGACRREYGSVLRRAKNVIYVAALNAVGGMTSFSSWGPMDDGRVVPTISMKGEDVYSTLPGDTYGKMSGTSMATPLVSGHLALMTERYHQLHHGAEPEAALLRALIIATADDVNAPGPDYSYGYGILNADAALTALEKGNYRRGSLSQGKQPTTFSVPVPSNAKRAWVALAWTDTVSGGVHPYGEPALVNDLNLYVSNGGNTFLPWVLDKDHPEADPQRKVDSINNAEIVSIDAPSGELTITVDPKRIASLSQDFYVVWHFDTDIPRITYPVGGELLEPGEAIVVHSQNLIPPIRAELSYDNGKTFATIATMKGDRDVAELPLDAPFTAGGILRLIDNEGRVVVSPHSFTIMPTPKNLRFEKIEGSGESVQLAWDTVPGIKKYEVLYTTDKDAEYRSVVVTAANKCMVSSKYLSQKGRYAFAVRAIAKDGTIGQRSAAVMTAEISQRNAASVAIPFTEEFRIVPSPDVFVELGEYMSAQYEETPAHLQQSPGAHALIISRTNQGDEDDTWDGSDPYTAKKAFARVGFETLDLTKEQGKVFLEVYGHFSGAWYPQMRLEVDGQPVKLITNQDEVVGVDKKKAEDAQWVWDLSGYKSKPINLALRVVVLEDTADLIITHIALRRESKALDLALLNFAGIERVGTFGKEVPVYSFVRNNSSMPVASAAIYATANGRSIGGTIVKDIKPFEMRRVDFTLDLTANSPMGELLDVAVELKAEGDANPEDNAKRGKLYSLGEKYAMKRGHLTGWGYAGSSDVLTIEGRRIIVDDGACSFGYRGKRSETLLLKPSNPDRAIAVTVRRASLLGESDALLINTHIGASSTSVGGSRNLATVKGELQAPVTAVSSADDGGVLLVFEAGQSDGKGLGWEVEAVEVARENTLKIDEVKISQSPNPEEMTVSAKVINLLSTPQTDVSISILQGLLERRAKLVARERIDYLKPEETLEYTFSYHPAVPLGTYDSLRVFVDGYDNDFSDNMSRHFVLNDEYCAVPPLGIEGTSIGAVALFDRSITSVKAFARGTINLRDTLQMYRSAEANTLRVALRGVQDGRALGVWVDWNDDKQFGDASSGEFFTVELKAEDTLACVPLAAPTDAAAGPKRMRVLLADKGSLDPCGATLLPRADARDYIVRLVDENFPTAGDLAIAGIDTQVVGAPLSDTAKITVSISNLSDKRVSDMTLAYRVDDAEPITERVALAIDSLGGTAAYTFKAKANLAAQGKHAITAWIASDNANRENDTARLTVHSIDTSLASGEDFYLHFGGDPDNEEMLVFSDLARSRTGSAFSFDMMLKLDHAQFAPICQADGFLMLACNEGSGFPENSILFAYAGTKVLYLAPGGTLKPGQWQHIAVNQTISFAVHPKLYVDGEEVNLASMGNDGTSSMHNFKAMYLFEGSIDHLRFWKEDIGTQGAKQIAYTDTSSLSKKHKEELIADFAMNEGYSNAALYAGEHYATIQSKRIAAGNSSIWQTERRLIQGIHFDNQVGDLVKLSDSHYQVTLTEATDLRHVEGIAYSSFSRGNVLYKGTEITEKRPFDFSEGSVTLYGTLVGYYGRNYFDKVTIYAVKEASAECKMLSLKATVADNAGLASDVSLEPVPNAVALEATEDFKANELTFAFSISEGATATVEGKPIQSPVKLDVTNPTMIRVLAANGRTDAYYTITVVKKNAIDWPLAKAQLFYGDSIADLPGLSSAQLPISYTTDNPNVITYTEGALRAIAVGSATVMARQQGDAHYAAAAPVDYRIEVLPRQATVAPRSMVVKHGAVLGTFDFYYMGVLPYDDLQQAKLPVYRIMKNGSAWSPAGGALDAGEYPIQPEDATPYRSGNYVITPLSGTLTVLPSQAVSLSLTVLDEENAVLEGATITVDSTVVRVSNATATVVELLPGVHSYVVTKEGYVPTVGRVEVLDAPIEEKPILRKRTLTLTYATDGGGILSGYLSQTLAKGEDGQPVFAKPNEGYVFKGWDDGVQTPNRLDRNVQTSKALKALFEQAKFTLSYEATIGGTITGKKTQTVLYGKDGEEVTATPDGGAYFIRWSDRLNADATRTDKNIRHDASYRAFFGRKVNLPYIQKFETSNELPAFMHSPSRTEAGWYVTAEPVRGFKLDGRFLAIKNPKSGSTLKVDLETPRFALDNVTGDISVDFDYIFYGVLRTKVKVFYQVAGETPQLLGELTKDPNRNRTHFSKKIENAVFAGKEWLQLIFNYSGAVNEYLCIDNLSVVPEGVTGEVQLNYYATKGGTVNGALQVNVTTPVGTEGTQVEAKAEAGWTFAGWSDGVSEPTRKDSKATTVEALFTPASSGASLYSLSYTAGEHGRIAGVVHQQGLTVGTEGTPVTAVATTPDYHFVQWSDGSKQNPRTDKVIDKDINVSASFSNLYTLTYTVEPIDGGEITGETSQQVLFGEDAKGVTATPKAGYHFVEWSDGVTTAERTDQKVQADATIVAHFAQKYTFIYTAGKGGTLRGEVKQTVDPNAMGTAVTAKPYEGFAFDAWSDGVTTAERTDKAEKEVKAQANFKPLTFDISYSAADGGTLQGGAATQTVSYGEDSEPVLAKADAGYHFVKWSDGRTDNPRCERAVVKSVTAEAIFSKEYTVAYTHSAGGTIDGEASQTVEHGADAKEVKATPDAGYHFVRWSDGLTDNPRTDRGVTRSIAVEAIFSNRYVVTYVAADGGSIEGAVTQSVEDGHDATQVKAKPEEGYRFVGWSDGSEEAARLDKGIKEDAVYTATFARLVHTLTVEVENGVFDPVPGLTAFVFEYAKLLQPTQEVAHGDFSRPVTLELAPGVKSVLWDDGSTELPRSFRVEKDMTVKAKVKVPTVDFYVERNGIPISQSVINNAFDGTIKYTEHQQVDLGTCVAVSWALLPKGTILAISTVGMRKVDYPASAAAFYQIVDGTKPARLSIAIERPSGIVIYEVSEGGTLGGGAPKQKVSVGGSTTEVTALPMPVYYFKGWDDGNKEPSRSDFVTKEGEVTYRALFERKTYTVAFMPNSGEGTMEDQKMLCGCDATLKPNAYTRAGATFRGWALAPDAKVPRYTDGDWVKDLSSVNGDTVHLYAVWAIQRVAVYFSVAGEPSGTLTATVDGNTITSGALLPFGTQVVLTAKPNAGYDVEGWLGVNANPVNAEEVVLTLDREATVQVSFRQIKHAVHFSVAGEPNGTLTATVDGKPIADGDLVREGAEVQFVAEPKAGFLVDAWTGVTPSADNRNRAKLEVKGEVTVTVSFKPEKKLGVESALLASIETLPNPFTSTLRISNASNLYRVQLLSVEGRVIRTVAHDGAETLKLDTKDLPAGLYLLRCEDAHGGVRTLRVVRE